jgi:hypothetical protein
MTKDELVEAMVDMNDAEDLARWIIELIVGRNFDEPNIEDCEEFQELAKDYEDEPD